VINQRAPVVLVIDDEDYVADLSAAALELRGEYLAATDEVELSVTDSGPGVAPDERERIFERFYRARQTIQDGIKGSGIGLYICRSIVELHGGRIWAAHARHGGPGLTVYARLPRVAGFGNML
jgi:signal transduction histidine kinase